MKFIVEVASQTVVPVIVIAACKQEAIECVLRQQGDACEPYPGETEVMAVRCLEE